MASGVSSAFGWSATNFVSFVLPVFLQLVQLVLVAADVGELLCVLGADLAEDDVRQHRAAGSLASASRHWPSRLRPAAVALLRGRGVAVGHLRIQTSRFEPSSAFVYKRGDLLQDTGPGQVELDDPFAPLLRGPSWSSLFKLLDQLLGAGRDR